MVKVALDESPGVLEYETSTVFKRAKVKYDPSQTDPEKLITQIKKRTRYADVRIKVEEED